MERFKTLPKWCITNFLPAFYDFESLTAIEQTGRLYKAIEDLINDYNKYVNEVNTTINEFMTSENKTQKDFIAHIEKITHDYIKMIDTKIKYQDSVIDKAVKYMKDNLSQSLIGILQEMRESGELSEDIMKAFDDFMIKLTAMEEKIPALETAIETTRTDLETTKTELETTIATTKTEIEEDINTMKEEIEGGVVKTINGTGPDENGDVDVESMVNTMITPLESIVNGGVKVINNNYRNNISQYVSNGYVKIQDIYYYGGVGLYIVDESNLTFWKGGYEHELVVGSIIICMDTYDGIIITKNKVYYLADAKGFDVEFTSNYIESLSKLNYLAKDNTTSYTPTGDYNPATKKYVDDIKTNLEEIHTTDFEAFDQSLAALDEERIAPLENTINGYNSRFKTLFGKTTAGTVMNSISYPSGIDKDNWVIISAQLDINGYQGNLASGTSGEITNYFHVIQASDKIVLNNYTQAEYNYRITFMRINNDEEV